MNIEYYLPYYIYDKDGERKILINEDGNLKKIIFDSIEFNSLIDENITYRYNIKNNEHVFQTFDQIIEKLYYYPESFTISKSYLEDYSKKEIKYLKKLKYFLLAIGLKDVKENEDLKSRSKYKNYLNYKKYSFIYKDNALDIINGNIKEFIINDYSKQIEKYSYMFLFDKNNNYYGTLKVENNIVGNNLIGNIEILTKFNNENLLIVEN